jgi:hypothetical protein
MELSNYDETPSSLRLRYGTTGEIKMGMHSKSENGRGARVTLSAHSYSYILSGV